MNIRRTAKAVCWLSHTAQKFWNPLPVDYTHVMVEGKIIKTGGAALVDEINESGFAGYEAEEHR